VKVGLSALHLANILLGEVESLVGSRHVGLSWLAVDGLLNLQSIAFYANVPNSYKATLWEGEHSQLQNI